MSDAASTYEAEQARLREEYDGKPQNELSITLPKEPEVNPKVWKDVEPVLYRGFLTVAAEINKVYFVFKSLNHHEFDRLRLSINIQDGKKIPDEFWNLFLAYGVFMVDGVNILSTRESHLADLSDTFAHLPKHARTNIIRHLSEVNRRASQAVLLTEAYAMESVSRYRWMQLKGLDLTSTAVTGVEGSTSLGLNWAQQLWRAINLAEDRNEQHERDWENAKFVGSCFAGKGLSKVYAQDTERRRKDKEEKISRKDRLLRELILGEKTDAKTTVLPGMEITTARTVEELADQLEKDLKGDQDWHDRVIAEHERRIKEGYKARQKQQEAIALDNDQRFGSKNVLGGTDFQGLTQQEMEERVRRNKQLKAQEAARQQVPMDERTQGFLDKWGVTGQEISSEVTTTDRDPSTAVPLPVRNTSGITPFRRK